MAASPMFDPVKVREALEQRSRGPFREMLARILECAPSPEAIRALAERHPDRWGQLSAMFTRAAGYTDKLEIEGSISLQINEMSDSELECRLAELRTLDVASNSGNHPECGPTPS